MPDLLRKHGVSKGLYDGRRVRLLTMIDEGNREGLEIAMGASLPGWRVVRVLNELVALQGRPSAVRVDNGRYSPPSPSPTGAPSTGGDALRPTGRAGSERVH